MIEGRVVLEKAKVLEGRMRYQIDKLVRVAEEAPDAANNAINGMLILPISASADRNDEQTLWRSSQTPKIFSTMR